MAFETLLQLWRNAAKFQLTRFQRYMSSSVAQLAVASAALLHTLFAAGELLPWSSPLILSRVVKKWPGKPDFSNDGNRLVVAIVHNAGVYNAVVAAALLASIYSGEEALIVQATLLAGGVMAGAVGALTLSPITGVQAIICGIALALKML